jgi:hypothetical protein
MRAIRGMTILEVTVASVFFLLLIGGAISSLALGQRGAREGSLRLVAQQNVSRALAELAPELRQSGSATRGSGITVTANADGLAGKKITFKKSAGISGSAVTWTSAVSYEWRAASSVDGKSVTNAVTRTDASGTTFVSGGIDSSFALSLNGTGDAVIVRAASTVALGDGSSVTSAVTETVLLRN